ncbi:hypothetical protein DLAC_08970 [Tieghemostelium lacteum]|uniref:Uncharacterized protein n=1 Tax=Tieghemostelium lacteum TaxID=361077 RepID=A0A151Z8S1_TIELA|nr:hypothetical protein DLAC_08970 [Tieghemostelium lacteum]|eukprot:KYQ90355.1 hypothetical protein DLAC_08970 [Tieghemostelium lacteum]
MIAGAPRVTGVLECNLEIIRFLIDGKLIDSTFMSALFNYNNIPLIEYIFQSPDIPFNKEVITKVIELQWKEVAHPVTALSRDQVTLKLVLKYYHDNFDVFCAITGSSAAAFFVYERTIQLLFLRGNLDTLKFVFGLLRSGHGLGKNLYPNLMYRIKEGAEFTKVHEIEDTQVQPSHIFQCYKWMLSEGLLKKCLLPTAFFFRYKLWEELEFVRSKEPWFLTDIPDSRAMVDINLSISTINSQREKLIKYKLFGCETNLISQYHSLATTQNRIDILKHLYDSTTQNFDHLQFSSPMTTITLEYVLNRAGDRVPSISFQYIYDYREIINYNQLYKDLASKSGDPYFGKLKPYKLEGNDYCISFKEAMKKNDKLSIQLLYQAEYINIGSQKMRHLKSRTLRNMDWYLQHIFELNNLELAEYLCTLESSGKLLEGMQFKNMGLFEFITVDMFKLVGGPFNSDFTSIFKKFLLVGNQAMSEYLYQLHKEDPKRYPINKERVWSSIRYQLSPIALYTAIDLGIFTKHDWNLAKLAIQFDIKLTDYIIREYLLETESPTETSTLTFFQIIVGSMSYNNNKLLKKLIELKHQVQIQYFGQLIWTRNDVLKYIVLPTFQNSQFQLWIQQISKSKQLGANQIKNEGIFSVIRVTVHPISLTIALRTPSMDNLYNHVFKNIYISNLIWKYVKEQSRLNGRSFNFYGASATDIMQWKNMKLLLERLKYHQEVKLGCNKLTLDINRFNITWFFKMKPSFSEFIMFYQEYQNEFDIYLKHLCTKESAKDKYVNGYNRVNVLGSYELLDCDTEILKFLIDRKLMESSFATSLFQYQNNAFIEYIFSTPQTAFTKEVKGGAMMWLNEPHPVTALKGYPEILKTVLKYYHEMHLTKVGSESWSSGVFTYERSLILAIKQGNLEIVQYIFSLIRSNSRELQVYLQHYSIHTILLQPSHVRLSDFYDKETQPKLVFNCYRWLFSQGLLKKCPLPIEFYFRYQLWEELDFIRSQQPNYLKDILNSRSLEYLHIVEMVDKNLSILTISAQVSKLIEFQWTDRVLILLSEYHNEAASTNRIDILDYLYSIGPSAFRHLYFMYTGTINTLEYILSNAGNRITTVSYSNWLNYSEIIKYTQLCAETTNPNHPYFEKLQPFSIVDCSTLILSLLKANDQDSLRLLYLTSPAQLSNGKVYKQKQSNWFLMEICNLNNLELVKFLASLEPSGKIEIKLNTKLGDIFNLITVDMFKLISAPIIPKLFRFHLKRALVEGNRELSEYLIQLHRDNPKRYPLDNLKLINSVFKQKYHLKISPSTMYIAIDQGLFKSIDILYLIKYSIRFNIDLSYLVIKEYILVSENPTEISTNIFFIIIKKSFQHLHFTLLHKLIELNHKVDIDYLSNQFQIDVTGALQKFQSMVLPDSNISEIHKNLLQTLKVQPQPKGKEISLKTPPKITLNHLNKIIKN